MIDSHCHLDFECYANNIEAIVQDAHKAGVEYLLSISTSLPNCDKVINIAQQFTNVFASVGIHPLHADNNIVTSAQLLSFTNHPKVIGLGETGLDFFKNQNLAQDQISNLEVHIEVAQSTGLPLIIHTRAADSETVEILTHHYKNKPFKGVIHCFTASEMLAMHMLDIGFYISVSGIITFKNAEEIRSTIQKVPLDRLLIETDAPFLAPIPKRGKENKPEYIKYTAEFLSTLKNESFANIAKITSDNFFSLFDKAKRYISE